jgi:adenosylcobyric acid synthase
MSLNSAVTDDGAEIGRAQAMQAAAARGGARGGDEPGAAQARLGPDLAGRRARQALGGRLGPELPAAQGRAARDLARCLADLRARYDIVVCEGAGSPAEINLRATDIANMGLARAARLPVLVVGDINPGGVFAALFGTLALLSAEDQALVCGWVVNKFRGDVALLEPGLQMLQRLTGRPTYGVLPWTEGLELDVEDSLGLAVAVAPVPPLGGDVLRVSVVRLPRLSNWTDVDALRSEPGVLVRFATTPEELADADLVVLPGTRATVADLRWLRARGLDAVLARARRGRPGARHLRRLPDARARRSTTTSSRGPARSTGSGLLPVRTAFGATRCSARRRAVRPHPVTTAYEIHHGVVDVDGRRAAVRAGGGLPGGRVTGTVWHGALESDGVRRACSRGRAARGRRGAGHRSLRGVRQARLDALGDLVADHLDTDAVLRLLEHGAPGRAAVRPPGRACSLAGGQPTRQALLQRLLGLPADADQRGHDHGAARRGTRRRTPTERPAVVDRAEHLRDERPGRGAAPTRQRRQRLGGRCPGGSAVRELLTAVRTARPSAPPTCWPAFSTAEAMPASSAGTPATAALVSATKASPMPIATMAMPGSTIVTYELSASSSSASQSRPSADSSGPKSSSGRGPTRPSRLAETPAPTPMSSVMGRKASPALIGL